MASSKRVARIVQHLSVDPVSKNLATITYLNPALDLSIADRTTVLVPPPEQTSPKEMELNDMRFLPNGPDQLNSLGFMLQSHTSDIQNFFAVRQMEGQERKAYYREMADLAKSVTGASEARVFNHFLRSPRLAKEKVDGVDGFYAPAVHNDYTPAGEDGMWANAERQLGIQRSSGRRICVLNMWRPIVDKPQNTLALCDARTVDQGKEAVPITVIRPTGNSDLYRYVHSPRHRWHYAPDMTHNEVLMFKTYDSLDDGSTVQFTPHGAVTDPTAVDGAPPRESIECRAYCIF